MAGRPARRAAAALCSRVRRRPVTGRARIWTQADSSRRARPGRRGAAGGGRPCARCAAGSARAGPGAARRRWRSRRPASGGTAGDGLGARPGPGGLDRPLDQARRDGPRYPEAMVEPAVGGGELEAEVGLAAERPSPGRAQQGDQVGPQGGRALGVDLGRGEHAHEPGALGQPAAWARRPTATSDTQGGHDDAGDERGRRGGVAFAELGQVVRQLHGPAPGSRRRGGPGSGPGGPGGPAAGSGRAEIGSGGGQGPPFRGGLP